MALNKTYSDLQYGFRKLSSGDMAIIYDENSINQSLRTLFRTIKGERIFNPNYGTDIPFLLFEPFDEITANKIATEIDHSIKQWEGRRIKVTDLKIELDYDNQIYTVDCIYLILSTTDTGELTISLAKQ